VGISAATLRVSWCSNDLRLYTPYATLLLSAAALATPLALESWFLMSTPTVYEKNGFADRGAYLDSLAADMGIDPLFVQMAADALGESEDFDGLVTDLEDWIDADMGGDSDFGPSAYATDEPESYSDADGGL